MSAIKKFWLCCLKCSEKSLVNVEFLTNGYYAVFTCYNCGEAEVMSLKGTQPPVSAGHFKEIAPRLNAKKKKPINKAD